MNRFIGLTTVALVATMAGTTLADGGVLISVGAPGYDGGIGLGGGAFTATPTSGYIGELSGPGSIGTSFQTFCLQENENVGLPGNYTAVISTYTVLEGRSNYDPSGPTAPTTGTGRDYLSPTTALLYSTFRNGGNFGGFGTGQSTQDLTQALQLAIWFSEGELTDGDNTFGNYSNYAGGAGDDTLAEKLFAWASNPLNNQGSLWDVRVLQLFNADGSNAQDMLTIVPLPPAAYAGMGTLAGVIGMGYIRRRRHANA